MDFYKPMAARIPEPIRELILEKGLIEIAINSEVQDTPMEYLFDVYEEFIDNLGEYDNWYCYKCREHILQDWKKMLPYLKSN